MHPLRIAVCLSLVCLSPPVAAQNKPVRVASTPVAPSAEQVAPADAAAQTERGLQYRRGQGVSRDAAEALRLFTLAAQQGDSRAEGQLAELYYLGEGVPRDLAEAVRHAKIAVEKGDASGQVVLGACLASGVGGVGRDEEEAVRLYKLSAEQNNAMAQLLLGGFYEKGRIVARDEPEAIRLYALSASQGMPQARSALARVSASRDAAGAAVATQPKGLLEIALQREAGVLVVPVTLGGKVQAGFVVDSGASDVVVPQSLIDQLRQAGQLDDRDFVGEEAHRMANGTTTQVKVFNLRTLQIGDRVLQKVRASSMPAQGLPLLGQTFLQRFDSWSIDNNRRVLVLKTAN